MILRIARIACRAFAGFAAAFVVAGIFAGSAHAAPPAAWKETGFSINADSMPLRRVLEQFCAIFGVRLDMTVAGDPPVKGRLQSASGVDFLDHLAASHRFRWFVYNDTLHVVPLSDFISARLEVGEDAVGDAKAALTGLGLLEPRFGWGELPDDGVVFVSGPRTYVDMVRAVLLPDGKRPETQERQLMVFRLRYASAADRVVSTRGQQQVLPGVKTILSNLLFGAPEQKADHASPLVSSRKRSREDKLGAGRGFDIPLLDRPSDGKGKENGSRLQNLDQSLPRAEETSGNPPRERKQREPEVRVEADPSLNAVLIYDRGSKRAMYEALIAELDIEPQQIEIEALIVDIDRSKLSQLGVEWGLPVGGMSATINGNATDSRGAETPISGSTILIRDAAGFYARLVALEGQGDAHVLAKPTVLTLENVAAVLDLSQSRYVPLVGERVADLADITAGTMLKVLPRIIRDRAGQRIRLDIDIEDGSVAPQAQNASTETTQSTITTQAIVEPQRTLLIGGYHSEARTASLQKIPILGDIPVVGALFRNSTDSVRHRERLFLITPRLVGAGSLAAAIAFDGTATGLPTENAEDVRLRLTTLLSRVPESSR